LPTYFEIVKLTLDAGYNEIEGDDKDKLIKERLEALTKCYNNVLAQGGPSYEDALTRFAYVFRYSTAHADYLNTIIGPTRSIRLASGDAIVLAGSARLAYHGVDRILPNTSTLLEKGGRINLTVRRVTRP
jgi:hypothetical protein